MSFSPFIPQPDDDPETLNRILFDVVLALRNLVGTALLVTIIDAKGDLIVGTAADVAARLAAGSNGQFLVVDSAEATGLKWLSHGSSGDPHSQYASDADLAAHAAAVDPHVGYILESLLDAKGDLIAATADNVPSRVGVGTNGQVLTANSGMAAGVEWASPATIGQYRSLVYVLDGAGGFDFVVDGTGAPVTSLAALE